MHHEPTKPLKPGWPTEARPAPLGVEQVVPARGRFFLPDLRRVVDQADHGRVGHVVVAVGVDVLQPVVEQRGGGGRVFHEQLALLQVDVVARVGRGEHVAVGGAGLQVLVQALERDLRRGAHHVDLHAGIALGEGAAHGFGVFRGQEHDVPGELALFLGGLVQGREVGGRRGLLGAGPRRGGRCRSGGGKGAELSSAEAHVHVSVRVLAANLVRGGVYA